MKDISREKIYGIVGTVLFHVVIFLLLYLVVMDRPQVEKETSFVEQLETGSEEDLMGKKFLEQVEEMTRTEVEATESPKAEISEPVEKLIANNDVPMPLDTVVEKPKPAPVKPPVKKEPTEEEKARLAEKKNKEEQDVLNKKTDNLFAKSQAQSNEGGDDVGVNDGEKKGGSGSGADDGASAGNGPLPTVELSGRTPKVLPEPSASITENCTVVVSISVRPDGTVAEATVKASGTTTTTDRIRKAALDAALKSKFSKGQGRENQSGKIIYNFKVQ